MPGSSFICATVPETSSPTCHRADARPDALRAPTKAVTRMLPPGQTGFPRHGLRPMPPDADKLRLWQHLSGHRAFKRRRRDGRTHDAILKHIAMQQRYPSTGTLARSPPGRILSVSGIPHPEQYGCPARNESRGCLHRAPAQPDALSLDVVLFQMIRCTASVQWRASKLREFCTHFQGVFPDPAFFSGWPKALPRNPQAVCRGRCKLLTRC